MDSYTLVTGASEGIGKALAQIAATNAKPDDPGLVLDTDPRRDTKTASAQTSDHTNEPDDDEPAAHPDTHPAPAAQQD